MDGTCLREVSKGCWLLRVEFNILIQSTMDETNYHRIHQNVGVAAESCRKTISVWKKGNSPQDDQSFVGCLQLLQNRETRDFVEINHFGQIDKKTLLMQASVEAHYKLQLQTS